MFPSIFLVAACADDVQNVEDLANEAVRDSVSELGEAYSENSIAYASDPGARFEIISIIKNGNGNLEVLNKRIGPSGVSFSRREISCSDYTFRYLGEGDTLDEAKRDGPNISEMGALTGSSASSDVANEACGRGL
jgi:hypothetical protein